jgi:hypothetical protein
MALNTEYDIEKAFRAIEDELIASMMRNLASHRAEETDMGFNWSQWQVEQLKSLEKYKAQNKKKFTKSFSNINDSIDTMIFAARQEGGTEQEQKILRALKKGLKASKVSQGAEGAFFRLNTRKLEALIKATKNDFGTAEKAMLRMSEDKYRQIIFNAQVYANTGAGTYEKAVDMATKDFLKAGINCIEYANGARHTMKDYAKMAIQTANKRAYLTGEGEMRQSWGISTVIMNKRANACPKCLPFVGKVLIDDVWSGGKASDGPYPLMSSAMAAGLYHPNCKDIHTTYFPELDEEPDSKFTKKELEQVKEDYKMDQKQQYAGRMVEQFDRLSKYSLDSDNKKMYEVRKGQWENVVANNQNSDTIKLKDKITDVNVQLEDLKKQFSDFAEGYSYDEWFKDFTSIEDAFGDVTEEDIPTVTKLKELDSSIRQAEKSRHDLILKKKKRKQLDIGYRGKVPDDKLDEFNTNALKQIKADTGYSDEKAAAFQKATQEYFGGDYGAILTGKNIIAKTISDGIDLMPTYEGSVYRGLCFSKKDVSQFVNLKPGDIVPQKGIISSWSSEKRVAEAFGAASTQSAETSTVILECDKNISGVGVQHLSKFGTREEEVLSNASYEVIDVITKSKYDYVLERENLLFFKDDLITLEKELKKEVVCVIKVKEV